VISRRVTGKLWFIFTQMLSEADHTRAPEEILRRAWNYAEQLEKLFWTVARTGTTDARCGTSARRAATVRALSAHVKARRTPS